MATMQYRAAERPFSLRLQSQGWERTLQYVAQRLRTTFLSVFTLYGLLPFQVCATRKSKWIFSRWSLWSEPPELENPKFVWAEIGSF